ncbi:hypothetical protein ACSSUQ_004229 [Yersinia enterocolitica]
MTDHKKEKPKKPAGWLDDMETFEKLSLETAFSDPNAGTYWQCKEEKLGDLQPFTTSYVRCDFKVVAEDEPRLIGFRVPKALEEKFKLLSHDALSNTILALADMKADELIRENKALHFSKKNKT